MAYSWWQETGADSESRMADSTDKESPASSAPAIGHKPYALFFGRATYEAVVFFRILLTGDAPVY